MATRKKTNKTVETVTFTVRPDGAGWELSNGSQALKFPSESKANAALIVAIRKNVGRFVVVAKLHSATDKLKEIVRYRKEKGQLIVEEQPLPKKTPKAPKDSAAPKAPAAPRKKKTPKAPAPKAPTPKAPAPAAPATKAPRKKKTPKAKSGTGGTHLDPLPTAATKKTKTPKAPKAPKTPKAPTTAPTKKKTPKARAPSEYNLFVKDYLAKHPGKKISDAAAAWKKVKSK